MRCHRIQPYLRNVVPNVYAAPINTLAKQLKGFGRQVGFAICGAPRSNLQITVRRTHATQIRCIVIILPIEWAPG